MGEGALSWKEHLRPSQSTGWGHQWDCQLSSPALLPQGQREGGSVRLGSSAALVRVSHPTTPTETEKKAWKSAPTRNPAGPQELPRRGDWGPGAGMEKLRAWGELPEPVRHVGTALQQRPLSAVLGTARVSRPVLGVHDGVKTGVEVSKTCVPLCTPPSLLVMLSSARNF